MKFSSLTLFFLFSINLYATTYKQLDKLSSLMRKGIRTSVACLPQDNKNGTVDFCSGFHLSKNEIAQLKGMSFNRCKKLIKKKFNFTLSQEIQPRQIKESVYSKFMHSTKRAQVYYPEKLVLLKQGTDRVDCIHELFHLYQYFSKSIVSNSIKSRKKLENKVTRELEKQISRVALFEKNKKAKKAQQISKDLQPYIKLLGRFKKQSYWLHEKEIYYYLYKNCDAFGCSVLDKDIALANLYVLRKYFPWRTKDWLISESAKLIKQKEYEVYKKIKTNWNPLKDITKKDISKLINSNLKELRESLKKDKIFFIKNSLFSEGVVCSDNELIILYKDELDHALVVASILRKKQLITNPDLCSYWPDTRVVSKQFGQGVIDRETFEQKVLRSKMAKVLSDNNIYKSLFNYQDLFPTDETNLILERWLNAKTSATFTIWENKLPTVFSPGMKLSFHEVNDLPMVYINSRKLVLDLGAMDSVIRPIALSAKDLRSMIILESKNVMTAEGREKFAPKVMLTTPLVHGAYKLVSTQWVLVDLKIIGVEGTFGLNNLFETEFSILPKQKKLVFTKFQARPKKAFLLQANFKGYYDSVEFKCPEGYIIRVDTGSQVRGDLKSQDLGKNWKNNKLKCGEISFKGPFEEVIHRGPIFGRDVILNLGWPLLREFKQIDISLKEGWIHFQR